MYEDWTITRWETPCVDIDRLLMVSLSDANRELSIVFEAVGSPIRHWKVRFKHYPAYRNIDEAFRLGLWKWLDTSGQRVGFTFTVVEPEPLRSWGTEYLHEVWDKIRHYVIATQDDVVEVLSSNEPIWEEVQVDERAVAGKGGHLYVGEDDEKIAQLVTDLQRRANSDRSS